MSKYKEIKGFKVQTLASDTAASVVATGTWASGGSLNTAVNASGASNAGTQTASINFAGNANPYPTVTAAAESYNGTSWGPISSMGTARWILSSFGTQTAAVGVSGVTDVNAVLPTTAVEQWNGTSWTEVAELATVRHSSGGFGTTTAGLIVGGQSRPGSPPGTPVTYRANVEAWNGTAWTETTDINTARDTMFSFGINTSGLIANGQTPTLVSNAESWNGSSWTEVAESNTTRYSGGAAGSSNTLGLIFGGYGPSYSSQTESWDGTSWTELNNLANTVANLKGSGSVTSALAYAGTTGSASAATEEWSFPPATASTLQEGDMWFNSSSSTLKGYGTAAGIPAATWATGGTLNAGHGYGTGFGSQTAAVCCFGGYPTHTNNTETYNGTAWTEVNEGNTARRNLGSFGILTSGLAFGGGPPFGVDLTESWNGTSWTEVNDLPTTVYNNRGIGASSSSGLSIGGVDAATPGKSKKANEWNGTSWTAISDMGTIRESGSAANAGSTTAALVFGGESPSQTVNTELWNGSSWTELNNLNTARSDAGGNGISTQALCFGGNTPSAPPYQATINEFWNGTSWTELNDLGTGIANGIAPAGGATSGLASGGQSAPATQNTVSQEFTASAAVSTVTTS